MSSLRGAAMDEIDYSKRRGVADEPHWNEFVLMAGGELVAPHIKRQGIKNADYMFPTARVIAELKIIETEFAHTEQTLEKVDALAAKYPNVSPDDATMPLHDELIQIIRKTLQRIINKANRQIKETKIELGLDALIYQTNHFVEIPSSPYALLLWAPMYSPRASDDLVTFVNDLGRKWRAYAESIAGPYDVSTEVETLDLSQASVVSGVYRNKRYVE
jgi:hypothetical protein